MAKSTISLTTVNPTMFVITNPDDPRLPHDRNFDFYVSLIHDFGAIYGSLYRPGEFWEEECFICPICIHATPIGSAIDEETGSFYCKYCHTNWMYNPRDHNSLLICEWED